MPPVFPLTGSSLAAYNVSSAIPPAMPLGDTLNALYASIPAPVASAPATVLTWSVDNLSIGGESKELPVGYVTNSTSAALAGGYKYTFTRNMIAKNLSVRFLTNSVVIGPPIPHMFTVRVNGLASAVAASVSSGTPAPVVVTDIVNTASIAAGSTLSLYISYGASTTAATGITVSLELWPA